MNYVIQLLVLGMGGHTGRLNIGTGCSLETDNCNIPFIFYQIIFLALFLLFLSSIHRAVFLLSGKIQIIIMQKLGHLTNQILKICKIHRK